MLRAWRDRQVLTAFEGRVLPLDARIAVRCPSLRVPDPRPDRDALIAATALEHGFTMGDPQRGGFCGDRGRDAQSVPPERLNRSCLSCRSACGNSGPIR
jgi:hypothetical protein